MTKGMLSAFVEAEKSEKYWQYKMHHVYFQVLGITYSVVQILRKTISDGIQQIPSWPVSTFLIPLAVILFNVSL